MKNYLQKEKSERGARMAKVYVEVIARFTKEGYLRPCSIVWEDGRKFEINSIIETRRAACLSAGGTGIRYACRISGHTHYLYYEGANMWFVDSK